MDAQDGISLAIGGTAVGAICTLIGALIKARFGKTRIEPDPLSVRVRHEYVTVSHFEARMRENSHDHENLFARMKAVEVDVGRLAGILETISEDLHDIKNLLMKQPRRGGKDDE